MLWRWRRHAGEIKRAIEITVSNQSHHYILLRMLERKKYERSLVSIDARVDIAYLLPFDSDSGNANAKGSVHDYDCISYGLNSDRFRIDGTIVAYR